MGFLLRERGAESTCRGARILLRVTKALVYWG